MSFRRALLDLALVLRRTRRAMAQRARQVEVGYEITFLGFTGFRIDFSGTLQRHHLRHQSHTFKEGMLRAVTMHYDGRNRAWGGFRRRARMPNGGSLSIMVGDKPRTWLAQYGAGRLGAGDPHSGMEAARRSRRSPTDKRLRFARSAVGGAHRSARRATRRATAPCPSNDGKRRIDIILKKIGTEPAATAGVPRAPGATC